MMKMKVKKIGGILAGASPLTYLRISSSTIKSVRIREGDHKERAKIIKSVESPLGIAMIKSVHPKVLIE